MLDAKIIMIESPSSDDDEAQALHFSVRAQCCFWNRVHTNTQETTGFGWWMLLTRRGEWRLEHLSPCRFLNLPELSANPVFQYSPTVRREKTRDVCNSDPV